MQAARVCLTPRCLGPASFASRRLAADQGGALGVARGPTPWGRGGEDHRAGPVHAIDGLELKQQLPVITDSNPDMDKHIMEFQSILDCQTFGRKRDRPIDVLHVFRKTLASGSTREKVYDT